VAFGAAAASCSWAGSGAAPGEPRVPWRGARAQPVSPCSSTYWIDDRGRHVRSAEALRNDEERKRGEMTIE
jgi:hypothetical protein